MLGSYDGKIDFISTKLHSSSDSKAFSTLWILPLAATVKGAKRRLGYQVRLTQVNLPTIIKTNATYLSETVIVTEKLAISDSLTTEWSGGEARHKALDMILPWLNKRRLNSPIKRGYTVDLHDEIKNSNLDAEKKYLAWKFKLLIFLSMVDTKNQQATSMYLIK